MSIPRPIWQEVPLHFKEDVVGFLDFKSRCSLSMCSHSDYELVQSSPLFQKSLEITIFPNHSSLIVTDIDENGEELDQFHEINEFNQIPADVFVSLIGSSSKSVFKAVRINLDGKVCDDNYATFLEKLFLKVSAKSRIKSKTFEFSVYDEVLRDPMLNSKLPEILKVFDSKFLENFVLDSKKKLDERIIFSIVESSQWKNLKKYMPHSTDHGFSLRDFAHLEIFEIRKDIVNAEDVLEVVQNFQSRDLPNLSYFKIFGKIPNDAISQKLGIWPTSRTSLPTSSNKVLMLQLENWRIVGVICRADSEMDDLRKIVEW